MTVLETWSGTRGRDQASQMLDLVDNLHTAVDSSDLGEVSAIAVKRPEAPPGRPTVPYDRKTRFEGVAMIAAASRGIRYFDFRKSQLSAGRALFQAAGSGGEAPTGEEARDALAAACAGLSLLHEPID